MKIESGEPNKVFTNIDYNTLTIKYEGCLQKSIEYIETIKKQQSIVLDKDNIITNLNDDINGYRVLLHKEKLLDIKNDNIIDKSNTYISILEKENKKLKNKITWLQVKSIGKTTTIVAVTAGLVYLITRSK